MGGKVEVQITVRGVLSCGNNNILGEGHSHRSQGGGRGQSTHRQPAKVVEKAPETRHAET